MGNEHIEFLENISKGPIYVQVLMVFMCAIFVVMLLSKKVNEVTQWLLMASALAFMENAGYLLVIQSKNVNEASIAIKVEYIGVAFISTIFMFFVLAYCNKKLPMAIKVGLLAIDISMILGVWFWEYTDLYYTSVTHRIVNGTVKLDLGRGILYYTGMCKMLLELLIGEIISIREWISARTKAMKRKYSILIIALFVPNISYICLLTGYLKAFDSVPASIAISCGVLFFGVIYMNIFEDVYVAYADIVRQMKEPVVIMNKEYCFVGANDSAKELIPKIHELKHGDSVIDARIIENQILQKLLVQEECEMELGEKFFDVSVNNVIKNNKTIGYYLLFLDLTRERQQTMKMQALKEEADKANQAKTTFLSNMSHEIRTPINAIMGMNEIISRQAKAPEIIEYSQNIQFTSKTLLSIVNDILDLSKIESGKMELLETQYNLKQLLYDCYVLLSSRTSEKELDLIIENNEKLPSILYGDELRIRQIITNLLSNAAKYTEQGSITLQFDGHITKDNQLQLKVSVTDTGIGIKEENIDKLFDVFQRVDLKKTNAIEGTGLGLPITKQLIDLMNGTITIESTYGVGSCFIVQLPQKIVDATPMGTFHDDQHTKTNTVTQYIQQFEAPEVCILVVDDVDMNLSVIKGLLKATKLQIDTASSGEECLQKVKEKQYDMIFMDHMMPKMDGIETLHHIKEMKDCKNINTPVIALTANAIAGMKELYFQEGFSDYLTKPVDGTTLESMILKYLPKEKRCLDVEITEYAQENLTITEQLKQVFPEMDTTLAMTYCADEEEILKIAIESYCEQDYTEQLEKAFKEKDFSNYQILAHTIKSSSLTIGMATLSELAKQLEQSCKDNNWSFIEEHHMQMYEIYKEFIKKLKAFISKDSWHLT